MRVTRRPSATDELITAMQAFLDRARDWGQGATARLDALEGIDHALNDLRMILSADETDGGAE